MRRPAGAMTPVHDHLAWGLVGLYRGTQDEEIYVKETTALEPREIAGLQIARRGKLCQGVAHAPEGLGCLLRVE